MAAKKIYYTAHTNDGMQKIAKALADDCGGRCEQNRGVDAFGRPTMTVYGPNGGRTFAEISSGQNVSQMAGEIRSTR